jgi:hypothetical protein
MINRRGSKLFSSASISEVFNKAHLAIKKGIEFESENYILNVNEEEYTKHWESKLKLDPPEIHFDQVYADSYEGDIPAEYFPMSFNVYSGKSYKKEIIQYFIPCSGNVSLLNFCPSSIIFLSGSGDFEIRNNTLVTEIINFSNDPAEINRKYKAEENSIHGSYSVLLKEIDHFNTSLKDLVKIALDLRKQKILAKSNLLASLGVPVRKRDEIATTFSVPKPQLKDKIIVKPTVNEQGFKPEPTLDIENYRKILKLINDVGKNFERMPSIYKGKSEEDLRDHILMTLDPNFELGTASGETFNKTGKTDIQLRYDSSVIFIAECKFWSGEKNYLSTIDQLLGYLTWRDTKASVIVFVKQKGFSAILEKIQSETIKHPNFLSFVDKTDENWFNFRFHINGDSNREVKLAIQLYHLPA